MFAKLSQLIVGLGVVAVALVVGLAAAGLINPSSFLDAADAPSSRPTHAGSPSVQRSPDAPRATAGPGEMVVMVGAGDIADCERQQDSLTADALERIDGIVFTLGDHAYPDASAEDFEKCYGPTWGRPSIKDRTRPTIGDDDYDTSGAAPYFEYFGEAAGDPATGYYAYDAGAWRVYVINSVCRVIGGCGAGSAEEAWLRADLKGNPRECVLAMWHKPYFTSEPSGGSDSMRQMWRVLYEEGADVVLNGDHHAYERFAAQTPAGELDEKRGIVEFVVGTGGGAPESFGTPLPNSLVRAERVSGVLRLELSPTSYRFEFIDVAGTDVSDRGERACH